RPVDRPVPAAPPTPNGAPYPAEAQDDATSTPRDRSPRRSPQPTQITSAANPPREPIRAVCGATSGTTRVLVTLRAYEFGRRDRAEDVALPGCRTSHLHDGE